MCRSCLQCWVSERGRRICAYCFLDLPALLAVDSKSSGNIFWADLPETRCHGPGISSSILDRRAEGIKHGHSQIELLAPPSQHRTGAGQEMGEDSRAMDGKVGLHSGDPKASDVPTLEAQTQEQETSHRTLSRRGGASGGRDGALSRL